MPWAAGAASPAAAACSEGAAAPAVSPEGAVSFVAGVSPEGAAKSVAAGCSGGAAKSVRAGEPAGEQAPGGGGLKCLVQHTAWTGGSSSLPAAGACGSRQSL